MSEGNSLTGSDRSAGGSAGFCLKTSNMLRAALHQDNFDLLEYPFLTMLRYPPAFIMHLGNRYLQLVYKVSVFLISFTIKHPEIAFTKLNL